jgi:hypothetical protein
MSQEAGLSGPPTRKHPVGTGACDAIELNELEHPLHAGTGCDDRQLAPVTPGLHGETHEQADARGVDVGHRG